LVMVEEFRRLVGSVGTEIAEGGTVREQLQRVAAHILFASRPFDFGRPAADLRDNVSGQRQSELMGRCAPPWEQISVAVERQSPPAKCATSTPIWLPGSFSRW
jgi:hypothetical protein